MQRLDRVVGPLVCGFVICVDKKKKIMSRTLRYKVATRNIFKDGEISKLIGHNDNHVKTRNLKS